MPVCRRFDGIAPSFKPLNNLTALTLFGNWIGGHLALPSAANMSTLLVQDNRLSCAVQQDSSLYINHNQNLLLPGNTFSLPIPRWARTSDVSFLYYSSWWHTWGFCFVTSCLGALAMGTVIAWFYTTTAAHEAHNLVQVRFHCAKALAMWSAGLLLVVIPIFYKGAHLYECGKPWMYFTAAYLYNDLSLQIVLAVVACLSHGIAAFGIRLLETVVSDLYESIPDTPTTSRLTAVLWALWLVITLILSIPSALYIVSTSLPPGGFLGSTTLLIFQHAAAPALYSISAVCIPPLARWVVRKVTGESRPCTAARLMIFARLMVTLVVPFGMVLLLSQGCQARWLMLWSPCREEGTFDISVTVPIAATNTSNAGSNSISITQHSEVCDPARNTRYGSGRCPIAVVDALGTLLVGKLLFAALVGPVRLLISKTKAAEQAKQWVLQKVGLQVTTTTNVDTEAAGIVMLLEIVLVLGFVVPVVPVVVCVAFLFHAKAF